MSAFRTKILGKKQRFITIMYAWLCICVSAHSTQSLKASEEYLADPFVNLLYSLEIAELCSHATDSARRGFEIERTRMIEALSLSKESIDEKSILASVLVDLEWQNRGLGGFRHWCANEAADAADHLKKIANEHNLNSR